jgi:hypothetical protein
MAAGRACPLLRLTAVGYALCWQSCHALSAQFCTKQSRKRSRGNDPQSPDQQEIPIQTNEPGETFKLNDLDVRGAQKLAYYYRSLCKRPIQVVVTREDDGYYCRRVA